MQVNREALRLERIANCDVFVGKGIKTPWERLFGGQTVAQSLMSACMTVPDEFPVHSLHSYFILAGDSTKHIVFQVERIRDGGSFRTRAVKALQDNKVICHVQASFHRDELGFEFQLELPRLLREKGVTALPDPNTLLDRPTEDASPNIRRYTVAEGKDWKISFVRVDSKGIIRPGDWKTNCSMLTFLSDSGMVTAARRVHADGDFSMSLSLDHSVHFHRPREICVENWLVLYHETRVSAGARGLASANAYNLAGNLLATFNQEALMRPASKL